MAQIKVYEMEVKIYTLQSFGLEEACSIISGFVDSCLAKDEKYLKFHNEKCFKQYSMNMPYPLESDGAYKKEKIYTVKIRTADRDLMNYLLEKLPDTANEYMKGLTAKVRVIPRKHIAKIYSITPVIMKLDTGRYWNSHISFEEYEELLKTNLVKKYNAFINAKVDEDFELYTSIQKTNRTPIKVKYKNISLLGDKFDIEVADNETAQNIAYLSLAAGWGGNNSRGLGFVNYKFL